MKRGYYNKCQWNPEDHEGILWKPISKILENLEEMNKFKKIIRI
jgi:hypothetical protein